MKTNTNQSPIPNTQYPISKLQEIPIPLIVPSRWQPRQSFDPESLLELAKHIKGHGLMYPIILFLNEDLEHELVAGERRTRAIAALGLTRAAPWTAQHGNGLRKAIAHTAGHGWAGLPDDIKRALVPTTITARLEPGDDHRRLHQLAVADNIQRKNLSPFEEARALHDLMQEHDLTQRDVGRQIGWSQSKVAQRLALLNLAPAAQRALSTRVLSISHARSLARLPVEVQPAVTAHVEKLVSREGDQAATVRQVAVLTQQLRKFLTPSRWLPPDDQPITPAHRNSLRLLHHILQDTDLSDRSEAIMGLHTAKAGYETSNILGKKPASLDNRHFRAIITALTGQDQPLKETWEQVVAAQGWTCDNCQFRYLTPPAQSSFGWHCKRWEDINRNLDDGRPVLTTCHDAYTAGNDPLIIPLGYSADRWARKLSPGDLITQPFPHFTDFAAWKRLIEGATLAEAKQQHQAEDERQNRHIIALAQYWQQQQPGGLFAEAEHFQAHLCPKCTHYRPDLLDRDLPPCEFVLDPLTNRYSNDPIPPGFGVLVRQDGLILPRCIHFRATIHETAGLPGFRLPDRKIVLDWLRAGLARGPGTSNRSYTIAAPLVWLPYPRPERRDLHDMDGLIRYIRRAWRDLGDEPLATLITTGILEARAMTRYRGTFELLDPTTLATETWAAISWQTAITDQPKTRPRPHTYPADWPTPWLTKPETPNSKLQTPNSKPQPPGKNQ
jgi:ParB family chromosome partitioning protein